MKANTKKKRKFSLFSMAVTLFFGIICVIALYPFWHVMVGSLISQKEYMQKVLLLWPEEITFDNYRYVLDQGSILRPLLVTIFTTVLGTTVNLLAITLTGYGLSKRFPGVGVISILMIITMFLGAGLIPNYILFRQLGILNSILVYILPSMINPFYVILMRTTFMDFPHDLEEAAAIDGSGKFHTFFRVVLPLSKPMLASIGLFTAVDYWNTFQQSVYYVTDTSKKTLQDFLYMVMNNTNMGAMGTGQAVVTENVKLTYTAFAVLPIILVYPFIQRHMSAGIMLGSLKG